jgi:fatty acid elongase 3
VILSIVGYVLSLFVLKWWMRDRKRIDVTPFVVVHNFFLCLLSVAMLLGVVWEVTQRVVFQLPSSSKGAVEVLLCDSDQLLNRGGHIFWYYVFLLSKVYEFLDTYVIILKHRPVIFLHVYHHCITLVLTFVTMSTDVNVQWMAISANACVHVFMYYYYAMSAMGYKIWWKKYLTVMQIIQFVADLTVQTAGMVLVLRYQDLPNQTCSGPVSSWWFGQFVLGSFLLLFIRFFGKTYEKKGAAKANDADKDD